MASPKKLKLKLLVDNKKKRVVFAEADKEFVDILFSFLTLPMGTIVRLLDKKTSLGCLDKLYESVEKLDEKYFETEACKTMLLRPLNASGCRGSPAQDLVLNVDTSNPRIFYICGKPDCCIHSFQFYSSVPNARCGCGRIMDFEWDWAKRDLKGSEEDGVFVREVGKFIISDDLRVMPASTVDILKLIQTLGIENGGSLEEMAIDLTEEVILNLLKRSLLSKCPLSGICFQEPDMIQKNEFYKKAWTPPKLEDLAVPKLEDSAAESKILTAKIWVCKQSSKVVYAETVAQEGLVDLLFSLLTFPLGSIVKLLDKCSSIGCVDNLYKSVENLSTGTSCMTSDEHIDMLIAPKLAPFFGCSNSLLPNIEMLAGTGTVPGCPTCVTDKNSTSGRDKCKHGEKLVLLDEMNPKRTTGKETGGGYAKEAVKFMITDELEVTPFSPLGSIKTVKKLDVTFVNLDKRVICIGETQALNLLKSCLTSQNALSNIFLPLPFSSSAAPAAASTTSSLTPASLAPLSFGKASLGSNAIGGTNQPASSLTSTSTANNQSLPSSSFIPTQSQNSLIQINTSVMANLLPAKTFGVSSFDTKSGVSNQMASVSTSTSAPGHSLSCSSTLFSQSQKSSSTTSASLSTTSLSPAADQRPPVTSATVDSPNLDKISSKSQLATTQPASREVETVSKNENNLLPTNSTSSPLPASLSQSGIPSSTPPLSTTTEKDERLDVSLCQEDEMASISTSTSAPSGHSLSSFSTLFSESQKSSSTTSASLSTASLSPTIADQPPPVTSSTVDSFSLDKVSSKSQLATRQSASREVETVSKNENILLPTNSTSSPLPASLSQPGIPSFTTPLSTTTEKDERLDVSLSQEDEMEEEAPYTTTLGLGSLGGFGLGSTPSSSVPKPNPIGGSFLTANTSTPRPPAQLVQTSQPGSSGGFSSSMGGSFSGFGQPAQMGVGQQALGTFGQSRQLGSGMLGIGFASSSSFSGSGFSQAANTGRFATTSGFAGTPGEFAGAAAGGAFTSVASSGGGFAATAKGGGFAALASGGGFAGATSGGGYGAVASSGGGFGTIATAGGGFAGAGTCAGFALANTSTPSPPAQPVQTSQPGSSGGFSSSLGGGFSGFGQPAQMGVGQQALGTFGQSRQLGSSMPGIGFASSSSFSGSGFSPAANTGGFATTSGFAGTPGEFVGVVAGGAFTSAAAKGGGFAALASGGGFAGATSGGASSGGGFGTTATAGGGFAGAGTCAGFALGGGFTPVASSGGGFAAAAKGGDFAALASGGGFAGVTSGGGYGVVAPPGGGFGATATAGGGFAGAGTCAVFASGGFGAFGSNQGGGFSAFGGNNAAGTGKPPAQFFTQPRK